MTDGFKQTKVADVKILRDPEGNIVYDANGAPMFAPQEFDAKAFSDEVANSFLGMLGFRPDGPFDLQRSYNGKPSKTRKALCLSSRL